MSVLAQFNVARLRVPSDDPLVAEFIAGLDPINRLAEESRGFVWRMDGPAANALARELYGDERIAVTLSLWEDVESLRRFVYHSQHVDFLRRRSEWFLPWEGPSLVLWWIPSGTLPTIEGAMEKLRLLGAEGSSPESFVFNHAFPSPEETEESRRAG